MQIIEQSIELMEDYDGEAILWKIEAACRNCYKSEGKNEERSREKRDALIRHAVRRGHTSVLEHQAFTFRVICNRGVSHEWVRHRIGCSYSQESTRYCNYGHSEGITVIWPWYLGEFNPNLDDISAKTDKEGLWIEAMQDVERTYMSLLGAGCKPEEARGVLPNDLKTEIVVTMNIVALRHFFELRCTNAAHPQIKALAGELLYKLSGKVLIVFDDLREKFIG